jgi:ribose transport system permease protein
MTASRQTLLRLAPALLFAATLAFFGLQSGKFLDPHNLVNILVQASSTGIVAVGMTFVLLTAGVDLSVGAIMFIAAAIAGKMALAGSPLPLALGAMFVVSLLMGAFNAFFITRVRLSAFIVTLAVLFIGRGLALQITETRAINLPDSFLLLGSWTFLRVPLPGWLFAIALLISHLVLTRTPFGRHVYAVGHDINAAKKAGLPTARIIFAVYLISGACAAIAAMVSLGQLGTVSPKFGEGKEFAAIAAAVLGGTSLFGGRGNVWPGTFLGAILIQTIENGLVILNADPYLYPMVISAVIFIAVLLESLRNRAQHSAA